MADEIIAASAKAVYKTMCDAIEHREWQYTKDEENLSVHFGVIIEGLSLLIILNVDPDRQLIRLISPLSFSMNEDKRIDGAIATCAASYNIFVGNFDYSLKDGRIAYRLTYSFKDSLIGEGLILNMISCACTLVGEYNDRFSAINNGLLSVDDFLKSV